MNSSAERTHDLLEHIAQALDRINRYTEKGKEEFLSSEIIQDAVIRNLEVVGEASRNLGRRFPSFAEEHPDLPLKSAYEMRNALAHGYFKIDLAIVWNTIESDLPALRKQVSEILEESAK